MMVTYSWPPPPPLIKGCRTFQKLSNLKGGGGYKYLLERGNKLEKGDIAVEMGGGHFFFTTLQFSSITFTVCGRKVRLSLLPFELAM